jgi:hypothetical protein
MKECLEDGVEMVDPVIQAKLTPSDRHCQVLEKEFAEWGKKKSML